MPSEDLDAGLETAAVRRWAFAGLGALSAVLLGVGLVVVQIAPVAVLAVPAVLVGLAAVVAVVRWPDAGLVGLLVGTVVLFQPDTGLQPAEVLYLLVYLLVLGTWYGSRLIRGTPLIRSRLDAVALTLAVVGVAGGAMLGVLNGAPLMGVQGEATGFSTIALFLPVRELVRTHRYGPAIVGLVLVWFGVWVAVRNAFDVYTAITGATQLWQIADVRAANGDILLHIATVIALGTAALIRGRALQLLAIVTGAVCFAGVFLAKSRGYWVDLAFAIVLLVALAPPRDRVRLVVGGLGTLAALALPIAVVVGPAAGVMLAGAFRRFSSIESSLTSDPSLINRFLETDAVWAKIRVNPLLGYGFGTEYSYHSVVSEGVARVSFIHNGLAGVWFKLGLWGLVLVVALWAGSGLTGIWASRYAPGLSRLDRGLALSAGVATLSLLPTLTTSNPFLLFDTLVVVTITMALAHGVLQRSRAHG